MEDRIGQFLDFMTVEKNASVNTVNAYKNDLKGFRAWLRRSQIGAWKAVDDTVLLDYIEELRGQGYADASVARKFAAVSSFFGYLVAEGIITTDPTEHISAPGVNKTKPRILTVEEVDKLLECLRGDWRSEGRRDLAMFCLLLGCGLRISQLVSLDVADLAFEKDPVTVRVVGFEEEQGTREIVVPLERLDEVKAYVFHVRPKLVRNRREAGLFLNRRGERLTRQGYWLGLKQTGEKAGVKGLTPHVLRHTCADRELKNGRTLGEVKLLLGHANIATTQAYLPKPEPAKELVTA